MSIIRKLQAEWDEAAALSAEPMPDRCPTVMRLAIGAGVVGFSLFAIPFFVILMEAVRG